MIWDFKQSSIIPKRSFCKILLGLDKKERYKRMLQRADSKISEELDLVRFIQRSRLTTFTNLASLDARQRTVADKMSTMLIRESSALDEDSDFDFNPATEFTPEVEMYSNEIAKSRNQMDKRLVRAYKAKRWRENFKFNRGRSSAFSERNLFDRLENKAYRKNQLNKAVEVIAG